MAESQLRVRVYDGSRQEFPHDQQPLITITDGNFKQIFRLQTPSGTVFDVPFYDNFGDQYTVLVSHPGFKQAGFTPVHCTSDAPQSIDIMLLGNDATFNFHDARWDTITNTHQKAFALLTNGVDPSSARKRYEDLIEQRPAVLACFWNIVTAMSAISLPQGSPVDYFKQVIWDETFAQDRFFAYADPALYDQVKLAALHKEFEREPGFAVFHQGATDSYKQIQFGEANVQLTFHANDTGTVDGLACIKMEPDIDYYKDPLAHGLLELVVNGISHSLTDPGQVYVLRWIAGRHAGVPEFDPPYTII